MSDPSNEDREASARVTPVALALPALRDPYGPVGAYSGSSPDTFEESGLGLSRLHGPSQRMKTVIPWRG
jgi:hypothetical protein